MKRDWEFHVRGSLQRGRIDDNDDDDDGGRGRRGEAAQSESMGAERDRRTGLRRRSNGSHEDVKFVFVASFLDSPALFFPRSPSDGWMDGWMLLGRGWLAEYIYISTRNYY
jgi:hypothetical protein